jgi:hypothetical protein
MTHLDQILNAIASQHLGISTLQTRRSDRLDFHDVSVWQVKSALKAAFDAGARELYPSSAPAPGLPTRFDGYEIHGVKTFGRGRKRFFEQADHWSLFGHIPGQGLDCIGDFATRDHAEEVFARITGRGYKDPATA